MKPDETGEKARKGPAGSLLAHAAIVLVHPKYPENIGATARVAANMGIPGLIVVREEEPDREKMLKMATHRARSLIDGLERFTDLREALEPFSCVVGTTARQGRKRIPEYLPRTMAPVVAPLLRHNRVALLFGPEHRGLTNEDLRFCQMTVSIPTADFSSLNLAQAVAIIAYELYWAVRFEGGLPVARPRLATSGELEGMYAHVEQVLERIGFLRTEDSSYWLRNIRRFLGRKELRAKEARIVRGFCRQLLWYLDGRK